MSFWTNREHHTGFDDAHDLAYTPSGGRLKMWLAGVVCALVPVLYGSWCLWIGSTKLFGRRGSALALTGDSGFSLAIAYIAVGAFIHFHFFWGLHPRLHRVSELMKLATVVVFLVSFGFALFKVIAE
jgi:hypothetical protein